MSFYQPPPPAGTPYDPNYGQNAAPSTTSQSPLTEFLTLASKGTRTRDWPTWMYRPEPESRAKRDQVLSMLTDRGSSALSPELHAALMPLRQYATSAISGDYLSGDPMAQMNNIYRTLSSPSMSMKGMLEKAIGASGPATTTDPNFTPPPPAQWSTGPGPAGNIPSWAGGPQEGGRRIMNVNDPGGHYTVENGGVTQSGNPNYPQGGLLDTLRGAGGGGSTRSPVGTGPGQTGMFMPSAQGGQPSGVGVGGLAGMQGLLDMLMKLFQAGGMNRMNKQQVPRMW